MTTLGESLQHARQLVADGQPAKALDIYRRLVQAVGQAHELWCELAVVHLQLQQLPQGIDCLRRAVALRPEVANYHVMLGTALQLMKRPAEAVDSFARALEIGPPTAELYNNLGLALKDDGHAARAVQAFEAALSLRPEYANARFNRGNLLFELGRPAEAVDDYQHVVRLTPADAAAFCKLGMAYYDLGRLDEALAAYERALEITPDYPDARRNRALIWLSRGQYARGWPEYQWRLACDGATQPRLDAPRWEGQPLHGRTLLVYAEQGLGDTLHFIRYLPLIRRTASAVLADVQPALVPLLAQSGFADYLVANGPTPTCDFQSPLVSLAGLAPAAHGQPFWDKPYLAADPRLVAKWKERLRNVAGFKIGIVWAGNPAQPHDRFRSVELHQFAPLAAVPGVRLISLQKGAGSEQLTLVSDRFQVTELGPELDSAGAFMDTAAVVQQLDLVIAVDTAVAHLAGGLGARVWLALDYSPDWRWLTEGASTAWYPSMRLFRQRQFGDWSNVFAEMADELRRLVAQHP